MNSFRLMGDWLRVGGDWLKPGGGYIYGPLVGVAKKVRFEMKCSQGLSPREGGRDKARGLKHCFLFGRSAQDPQDWGQGRSSRMHSTRAFVAAGNEDEDKWDDSKSK